MTADEIKPKHDEFQAAAGVAKEALTKFTDAQTAYLAAKESYIAALADLSGKHTALKAAVDEYHTPTAPEPV